MFPLPFEMHQIRVFSSITFIASPLWLIPLSKRATATRRLRMGMVKDLSPLRFFQDCLYLYKRKHSSERENMSGS